MQAIPYDVLDIIKANGPEIKTQNLALTCKNWYGWRCNYIAKDSTRASSYASKLLANTTLEKCRESLQSFKDTPISRVPIHLDCPTFVDPKKLEMIKEIFPNVQTVRCMPYFKESGGTIQQIANKVIFGLGTSTRAIYVTGALVTILLLCAVFMITLVISKGLEPLTRPFPALQRRVVIAVNNFLRLLTNSMVLPIKWSVTPDRVIKKLVGLLTTYDKCVPLESIATHFPHINNLKLDMDKDQAIFSDKELPLPRFDALHTITISSPKENPIGIPVDLRCYTNVTALHLSGNTNALFSQIPMMHFPPQVTTLTCSSIKRVSGELFKTLLESAPHLQSLSVKTSDHMELRLDPTLGSEVEKLQLEAYDFSFTAGAVFPRLHSLAISKLSDTNDFLYPLHLAPLSTLQQLSIKCAHVLPVYHIAFIFQNFPNLKTFTYCLPQEIEQPASHPELHLQKLSPEEIQIHFNNEYPSSTPNQ